MPTGYTEIVERKPDLTFQEFALRCARAFGALITLREDSLDAPVPEKFTPSDYYEEQITEAKAALAKAEALTDDDADRAAIAQHESETRRVREYLIAEETKSALYARMLAMVKAWSPPTEDHEGLKRFMIEQIEISKPSSWRPEAPAVFTGAEFRTREADAARADLARAERSWAEECARTDERNAWIDALRKSLVQP